MHKKELIVDKCLRLEEIGFKLLAEQNVFKPFGMGNTKPLYLIEDFSPQKISFL
jgi:single-stranded DNA-specific DHH superfamily exonuclease